tara:strand:- start:37570 stop:38751 length:1182 start_codon:yes stop_codon:yes gene_type:complete
MKVGVIVDNDLDSDVRVLKEIKMLRSLGYDVSVLCFDLGRKSEVEYDFEVVRIKISQLKKNILVFLNLLLPFYRNLWKKATYKFLKSRNIDIVHTHDLYMAKPVKGGIEKTGKTIPLILDLHENYPVAYTSYSWVNKPIRRWVTFPEKWKELEAEYLEQADGLIVLSDYFGEDLRSRYPFLKNRKLMTLPNIPDLSVFKEPEGISRSDKMTFMYFGSVGVRRGILDVMDAFIDIQKRRDDLKLLIIGPLDKGDKVVFNRKMNTIKSDMIEYISWVPLENMDSYMDISDVGLSPLHINPQHESGVANKIYQYMYGELCLLVSNCKPQQRIVEQNGIGLVFDIRSHDSLVSALEYLADNSDQVKSMGENANKVLYEKYSLTPYEKKLDEFYKSLI